MLSKYSWIAALMRYQLTYGTVRKGSGFSKRKGIVSQEQFRKRLHAFISLCRSFGIKPVLMTEAAATFKNEMTPDWLELGLQDQFNQTVREVGAKENVIVIDLSRYFREEVPEFNEPNKVFYDGLHFTDYGSKKCA
jgi:hypothetical protein